MSIATRRDTGLGGPGGRRFRRPGDGGGRLRGPLREVSLQDKYVLEQGRILLTGLQGLVRLPLDQHRADRRLGLHTGTMISGYQGSPLGGLDKELARNRELVEAHHVRHVPGLNEELGATSAWGSQLANQLPGARYDGVLAMWYGKAPGLDRAADSLRHGNFVGVPRTGGALAVVGDDPGCKSSTIPSASESLLASLGMPVFYPGNVQEVLDLGLHAYSCSRASGLWAGFKIVTSVADALGTAAVAPDRIMPVMPTVEWNGKPYHHVPNGNLLAPASLDMERTLFGPRTELALAYARENGVNRIEGARDAWLGVVAAGKPYYDLMHALRELGLDSHGLERAGIRILKLGMISPVEGEIAREFARKLAEIHGRPAELPMAARTPFFCSGCPHNSSVQAPDGTLVGAGIGCHTMVLLNPEGKRRTIITAEDTSRYRGVELASIAEVRDRGELLAAQQELAGVEGVTVLIHDQECAAELRRKRKRGKAAEPAQRVFINERVCEGCGDCGKKSNCLSVIPVETEFGRKTQIHQASCNKDFSCLEGDCPSFLTVVPGEKAKHETPSLDVKLPEPRRLVGDTDFGVRMMGIGGTGVVTVNQVLGMAALIDGLHVSGLDQTGLSQKGGPVISDLRITREPLANASKAPAGSIDLYLGFDLLGAASAKNLVTADRERTVAVVSTSAVPTGRMVVDVNERFPELADQLDKIDAATRSEHNLYLDAQQLSERLFGDHMMTNTLALGAAYQRGLLPVSAEALERAIELNGAAVEKNLAALRWGRAVVAAPDAVEAATRPPEQVEAVRELSDLERELVNVAVDGDRGDLRRLAEVRVPELMAYQDADWARRWAEVVRRVHVAEQERTPGHSELTEAVARQLYKLMAYKDEYEVARLHLDAVERAKLDAEFGEDAKVYFMLHPPLLRALGLKRKLKLGGWFVPAFRALYRMRRLRGTRLDPFGMAKVRRVERELIGEYEATVGDALSLLTPETHATALELLELPDVIRGYEEIKLRNVTLYRKRADATLKRLRAGKPAPSVLTL